MMSTSAMPTARHALLSALAAAVMLSPLVLLGGCSSEAAPPLPAHPVLVMTVKGGGGVSAAERSVPGVVTARYATDIGFQAGGRIGKRLVEVGQVVRKGQPLLQLDASDYTLALAAARDQATAARVQAEQATSDEQRFRTLVADGAVSVADSERQKARAEAARAQYQQASRQVELAQNRSRYATLVAPYDGVVTGIRAEAGQIVSEGLPVLSMARPGEVEIAADIPESLVSDVPRQQAQAEIQGALSERVDLVLRELSPAASQPLRTYRARFALRNVPAEARARLRLGMTAQVLLSGGRAAGSATGNTAALTLPASALVKARGQASVWQVLAKEGRLALLPVQVQSYQNDTVTLSGVPAGAQVVIAGVQKLDAKMRVRPVERTGAGLDVGVPGAGS